MKCDNFGCGKDAIITLADPALEIKINVCQIHYNEVAESNGWKK